MAAAAPGADGRGRDTAPGRTRKAEPATPPSSGTPTAEDHRETTSTHDADNGSGGQVCDGDPSGKSDGGGGANGGGENYDSTCPDGPSQNGAGAGAATGKPCAGCVGAADDKNPPGQDPTGPVDHNNGYECDQKGRSADEGNNGVGYGNPAHTGCSAAPTPPPTPTCPDGSAMPASGDPKDCGGVEAKTCPDGSAMPASGDPKDCGGVKAKTCPDGSAMPASGDPKDCGGVSGCVDTPAAPCRPASVAAVAGDGPADVLGDAVERPTEVLGVQVTKEAPAGAVAAGGLARTGSSILALVQVSLALGLGGLALTAGVRRRDGSGTIDIAERLAGY